MKQLEQKKEEDYSFYLNNDNSPKPKEWKWKLIALCALAVLTLSLIFKDKKVSTTPSKDNETEQVLPPVTTQNFLDCYSQFHALTKGKKLSDSRKLYAAELAKVQYDITSKQLKELPEPTKNNVEEMRRKVYGISWMMINGYDNICVYYSDGPLTKRYFVNKLTYVRKIADVYHEMGYPKERINNLLGDSPGNYYGIKN